MYSRHLSDYRSAVVAGGDISEDMGLFGDDVIVVGWTDFVRNQGDLKGMTGSRGQWREEGGRPICQIAIIVNRGL